MQFNLKVCKSWSLKSFLFRSTLNNPSNCYVYDNEFNLIFSTRQVFDETPHPQIVFIEFAKTCSLKVHGIFVIDLINYQLQNPLTKTLYKIIWGKCAEWYFICKKNIFQIICNFFSFIFWNRPVNHNIKTLLIYVWTIFRKWLCNWKKLWISHYNYNLIIRVNHDIKYLPICHWSIFKNFCTM